MDQIRTHFGNTLSSPAVSVRTFKLFGLELHSYASVFKANKLRDLFHHKIIEIIERDGTATRPPQPSNSELDIDLFNEGT